MAVSFSSNIGKLLERLHMKKKKGWISFLIKSLQAILQKDNWFFLQNCQGKVSIPNNDHVNE